MGLEARKLVYWPQGFSQIKCCFLGLKFTKWMSKSNREDPDQTASLKQSDLGMRCLPIPFWQATGVRNLEHLL